MESYFCSQFYETCGGVRFTSRYETCDYLSRIMREYTDERDDVHKNLYDRHARPSNRQNGQNIRGGVYSSGVTSISVGYHNNAYSVGGLPF